MFDRLRPRSQKRKPSPDLPLWEPKISSTIIEPAIQHWPAARDQALTVLKSVRDKFSETYVAVAEVVTEKKEAWEDRRAEEKEARQNASRDNQAPKQ